ncbi:putative DMT superfamily transporter inner membrane protein [Achromobacter spanius]|uniref:DMT family transporter n=1 Tax=Achromobacter spanius TaxID=217203 RepID=UPI000C2C395C|nr:DMT family transporter [Achromobacter spanius]AUA56329.1 EamA family transporter [Achromobacter spanius]CAB3690291.1 IS1595 family transposase ISBsp7 [Achromobacter spanius]SPT39295.1 putative DMT superfamily transporter inner membrane protein [Achromobacter denitrificans]VEE56106.1 putative DMT superfamily transporter inner membrane protein [Achromobacter spanius]
MRGADWLRLLVLSAVWGASFIFMRVLSPVLGPVVTADLRVAIGGGVLLLYFAAIRFKPDWRAHWRQYVVIGSFNVGLPFLMFSYAAQHVPASYSAIINATTPLFGTAFSVLWLGDAMTRGKGIGLMLGVIGVATMTGISTPEATSMTFFSAILACLIAAASYAGAGVYIKRYASHVNPLESAGCAQLFAAAALLPFWFVAPAQGNIDFSIVLNVLGLGILSSGLGFLLYFRLVRDIGPPRAMMVAFLAPLFGIVFGVVFLEEALTPAILLGGGLIIASTILILCGGNKPKPSL